MHSTGVRIQCQSLLGHCSTFSSSKPIKKYENDECRISSNLVLEVLSNKLNFFFIRTQRQRSLPQFNWAEENIKPIVSIKGYLSNEKHRISNRLLALGIALCFRAMLPLKKKLLSLNARLYFQHHPDRQAVADKRC